MKPKTRNILKYTLSLLLAAVLLHFAFRGVNWTDFLSVLKQCEWAFVLLSMLAGAASMLLRALRWRLLLLPMDGDMRRSKCVDGVNIGKLADFVFPHIGELVRCGYVTTRRLSYDKALGTVVLERGWDLCVLALLCVSVMALKREGLGEFVSGNMIVPAIGGMRFSLWWVLAAGLLVAAALAAAIPAVRNFAKGVWRGVASCMKMRRKWLFMLYTIGIWAMYLTMCLTVIYALPGNFGLGVSDALFIMIVGSIAGIVPVPGGFGAFHYMVAFALDTVYGIPFETGIIFATLSHESQAVTMAICGLASYVAESLSGGHAPHAVQDWFSHR